MKPLKLNIEKNYNAVCNVLREKQKMRNAIIDAKREYKKDKEKIKVLNKELAKLDNEILELNHSKNTLENDFDKMSKNMGFIRLKNYVLAEALYDNLVAYKSFIKKNCYTDDANIVSTLETAINEIKKLPFECGDCDNDRFREVYNAIADAYIERQSDILEGIFNQVMIELERDENAKIRK